MRFQEAVIHVLVEPWLNSIRVSAMHVRRECERDEGMVKLVKDIQGSDSMAAALLIECRGRTTEALEVCCVLLRIMTLGVAARLSACRHRLRLKSEVLVKRYWLIW